MSICLLQSGTAAACIRLSKNYTVSTTTPGAMAEAVPLNAPIVVAFDSVDPRVGTMTDGYSVPVGKLREVDNDFTQTLRAIELGTWENKRTAFIADVPLLPNTQYSVDVGDDMELPTEQQFPHVSWTFTTAAEPRAPLRLDVNLSVTFEAGTDPHYVCENTPSLCGPPNCQEMGTDQVTKARLQLPPALDGFSDQYLSGYVEVTPEVANPDPTTTGRFQVTDLIAGQAAELLVTLPGSATGQVYTPCFTYHVSDARGDEATALLCAETPSPPQDAAGSTDKASPAPEHTSRSCSVSSSAIGDSNGTTLLGFALLSLTGLRRRKRREPMAELRGRGPNPGTLFGVSSRR